MTDQNHLWNAIAQHISRSLAKDQAFEGKAAVSGGDIAEAFCLTCNDTKYFVKVHNKEFASMFEAEFQALEVLDKQLESIDGLSPRAICHGVSDEKSYLVMEYLTFGSTPNDRKLGLLIGKMHQIHNHKGLFGWPYDNFIGLNRQQNTWTASWSDFFWQQRLAPQLAMAQENGFRLLHTNGSRESSERRLRLAVDRQLRPHKPKPSLVHGDLWSGNKATSENGQAIIFDPAAYYGDAETDLAMTELFGGFDKNFYLAYHTIQPRTPGYEKRKDIYNLYHMLNHLNLFGKSYEDSCRRYIERIHEA